jgi:hypothetical protein
MTNTSYSVFNAMVDIVAAPAKAFEQIKPHGRWFWWPLLVTIVLACALLAYYYSWVDFEWLIDRTIDQIPAENRAAGADAIRSFMSPRTSIVTSVLAVVVISFVIYLLQGVYFHLANKLTTGADIGFGKWFGFAVWASFVSVFGSIAGFVVILTAGSNQLPPESLQVFGFNQLLIHAPPGDPWATWGSFLNLLSLWSIALAIIGYARWTGASLVKSSVTVLLPWVLIFGTWAALI